MKKKLIIGLFSVIVILTTGFNFNYNTSISNKKISVITLNSTEALASEIATKCLTSSSGNWGVCKNTINGTGIACVNSPWETPNCVGVA